MKSSGDKAQSERCPTCGSQGMPLFDCNDRWHANPVAAHAGDSPHWLAVRIKTYCVEENGGFDLAVAEELITNYLRDNRAATLDDLISKITPENVHKEQWAAQPQPTIWPIQATPVPDWAKVAAEARTGEAEPQPTKELDGKFGIDTERNIVNLVSGEKIPDDEPLFLLRARDGFALAAIHAYQEACDGVCNDLHLAGVQQVRERFCQFAAEHPERMKQPGITRHLKLEPTQSQGAELEQIAAQWATFCDFNEAAALLDEKLDGDQERAICEFAKKYAGEARKKAEQELHCEAVCDCHTWPTIKEFHEYTVALEAELAKARTVQEKIAELERRVRELEDRLAGIRYIKQRGFGPHWREMWKQFDLAIKEMFD